MTGTRVKILMVDDRPENLLAIEAILEGLDLDLVRASSGEEALKAVLRHDFAAILMDVQMPGMSGFETATLIKERERSRHVPIIFLTAINKEDRYAAQGYAVGAVDYLTKPFDPDVLRAKVMVFVELDLKNRQLAAAEARVRQQQQLTERLLDTAPAGIAYVDDRGILRSANPEFARLSGRAAAALPGTPIAEVLGGEPRGLVGAPCPGGGDRLCFWDVSVSPVQTGLLVFALDVTDRVENERIQREQIEKLRQVDTLKDEFLSVISHELRTPLNFIMGFASILDDGIAGDLNGDQRAYLDKILKGTDRMLLLVNDLLDFAKIQAGELELLARPCPYAPLVDEVVATLEPLADQKRIVLHAGVDPELMAWCDPQRVIQVLTNLVGNAIKFTPEGGAVMIHAVREGEEIVTAIEDSGIGIAAGDLGKLFTRFRQLDMSRTRAQGGTGLGLSITKALVEAHGGRIAVASEGPGLGSVFTFTLRAEEADISPDPGSVTQARNASKVE